MSGFFIGTHITEEQVVQLEETLDEETVRSMLGSFLNVFAYDGEKRQKIATDFHFFNYAFCKSLAFDPRRTCTFLSIMTEVFLKDTASNSYERPMEVSVPYFQQLLLKHSVQRPPKTVQIFLEPDVQPLMEFAFKTYYKNYKIYNYIFGTEAHIIFKQLGPYGVESPSAPPALALGVERVSGSMEEE